MALTKEYDANFEYYFWSLYPKKVGKAAAEREWLKLKLSEDEMREMREHLEIRLRTDRRWLPSKDGKTFIVDPERFLKHRRFEDVYEKASRSIPARVSEQQEHAREQPPWVQRGMTEEAWRAHCDAQRDKAMAQLREARLLH